MNESSFPPQWSVRSVLLLIALPLILGVIVACFIPQPLIGVIYLDDAIYSYTAQEIIAELQIANQNPTIKAVVMVINTPGGTVADSESVYFEINRVRQNKPVITMVESMAASGGYYLAAGSDYIFAKPGSIVGNIGVIGYVPEDPELIEGIYSTGPYKMWSEPRDQFIRELEIQKEGFYEAVRLGRGEALSLTKEEVLSGQVWLGSEAVKNGIIDELGSVSQAYDKAASMAHISHYKVIDLHSMTNLSVPTTAVPFYGQAADGTNSSFPNKPGLFMLYIPSMEVKP